MIFSKPVTDLTRDDLDALIGITESDRVDYKRDAYERRHAGTREFLKDITSMANAHGGYLFIGIEEGDQAQARTIVGIPDAEEELKRMVSACRSNIEEQIIGLRPALAPVSDDRHVLVWFIPRSTRAPHMFRLENHHYFYKRSGTQNLPMTIEEIRDACLRTTNIRTNLESFIEDRRERARAAVGSARCLVLTATPLVVRDELFDTNDPGLRHLLEAPPGFREDASTLDVVRIRGVLRPSMYGLVAHAKNVRRLELMRNGHAEFQNVLNDLDVERHYKGERDDRDYLEYYFLNPYAISRYIIDFLLFMRTVSDHVGILEPTVLGVSLLNIRGLAVNPHHPHASGHHGWDRLVTEDQGVWLEGDHLELPLMQFPHPIEPLAVGRHICNRLWEAFGFDGCPVFDDEGNFR